MTPRAASILALICACLRLSARADTIQVTAPGVLTSGNAYVTNGKTLAGGGSISIPAGARNVTIKGVKLNGIGITIGPGTSDVTIDGCTVLNVPKGIEVLGNNSGALNQVATNLRVIGNRIDNCSFRGFWGNWNLGSGFVLSDNTFTNCGEGAQGTWAGPFKGAGYIGYNEVSGHTRHGLEFQYQYRNAGLETVVIENNHIHGWRYGGPGTDASSIGISGALAGYLVNGYPAYARGILIQNNFIDGSADFSKAIGKLNTKREVIAADWFVGIEAMAEGTFVYNNVIRGYRHGVEVANINNGRVTDNVCAGDVGGVGTKFVGLTFFRENGNGFDWGHVAEVVRNRGVAYEEGLPTFKYGPRVEQEQSGIDAATGISPPTVYVNADGSLVSFGGLQPGDTLSVHGQDRIWKIIGTAGGETFNWPVPPEFDNWFVWVKRSGASESAEVKVDRQLHYVVPVSDTAELQAKVDALTVEVIASNKRLLDKSSEAEAAKAGEAAKRAALKELSEKAADLSAKSAEAAK